MTKFSLSCVSATGAHLAAATAVGLGYASQRVIEGLWAAFDRGSWFSPQLAVAACLTAPDFETYARGRIGMQCATNPARVDVKALTSLLYLCGLQASWSPWLEPLAAEWEIKQRDIAAKVADERNGGDRFAERWMERFIMLAGARRPIAS